MPTDPETLKRIVAENKAKQPGEAGAPIASYATIYKAQNPDIGPGIPVEEVDTAEREFESRSGKTVEEMTEQDFFSTDITFRARELTIMTDLHVVLKDKAMAPRWFQKTAARGRRIQQALMMGWRACTLEDCETVNSKTTGDNGAVESGDLVLMMKAKVRYLGGDLKSNMESAKTRVNRSMASASSALSNAGISDKGKGEYFIPDIAGASHANMSDARRMVYSE